jgi:alpha-glucosidase (family GH31 glycosyl hydrolase)
VACLANLLLVRVTLADIALRPSGPNAVRITLADDESQVQLNPGFVEKQLPPAAVKVKKGEMKTKEKVGDFLVSVSASPLTVKVEDAKGHTVQEIQFDEDGKISFPLGKGSVLGLGEGAEQLDRRGRNYPIINGQSYKLGELGARIFSPFLLSSDGWSLFIGSPYAKTNLGARVPSGIDLTGERGVFTPPPNEPAVTADVIVIDSREPANAMKEYIRLTGAPVMPPKWALGYMQSHRTLSSEADLLNEAKLYRDRKLPVDAIIYLGTGFCPAGWNFGHDSFEFNDKVFTSKPAEFIKQLHDLNLKVALHIVPQEGPRPVYRSLHGNIPPKPDETVDHDSISEYWKRHKELIDAGVDGWWPDEGDWFDIPSRLARHRMYYYGPLSDKPNTRPWNLQRNGFCGIGPTGGWYWSGDIQSTWNTFAQHVKIGQNASLSVSPYWGTDIGGFYPAPSKEYTGELYTRWFQWAAFCPSFRSHGRTWMLHTPWGWNTGKTGPIESRPPPDESELHNESVEPICRDYLNLRYQLMPYTYTIAREAYDTGMPLIRALWLHYPDDPDAVKRGEEYLWGRDLLIAPITEKGATIRELYLPPGDWYDWWTNEKTTGKKMVTKQVDLKTMPIYVRAGAIIPFDPVRQYVDEAVNEPTTIRVYTGADGNFVMYDDDGKSQDYQKDVGAWTAFKWNDAQKKLEISTDKRTDPTMKQSREFDVQLLPANERKKVKFTGDTVTVDFGANK